MSLRVEPYAGTAAEWDTFGAAERGWTAFHRHAWHGHIQRVFGQELMALCAQTGDRALAGLLILVRNIP